MSYIEKHTLSVEKSLKFIRNHDLEDYSFNKTKDAKGRTVIQFVNKTGFFGKAYDLFFGPSLKQSIDTALRIFKEVKSHNTSKGREAVKTVRHYSAFKNLSPDSFKRINAPYRKLIPKK